MVCWVLWGECVSEQVGRGLEWLGGAMEDAGWRRKGS